MRLIIAGQFIEIRVCTPLAASMLLITRYYTSLQCVAFSNYQKIVATSLLSPLYTQTSPKLRLSVCCDYGRSDRDPSRGAFAPPAFARLYPQCASR